ncbi:S8 family serine peptidase [Sungkyunkwania multivorans]|uniref:S8 family serine peptidase n=1 Tax=Sungkyunkwania multivorans TaxID=1173618 RepID=A0ABW3CX78_9FLAO
MIPAIRYLLFIWLTFIISTFGFGQNVVTEKYSHMLAGEELVERNTKEEAYGVFLIESPLEKLRAASHSFDILRVLDKSHAIVRFEGQRIPSTIFRAWPVNHEWKLQDRLYQKHPEDREVFVIHTSNIEKLKTQLRLNSIAILKSTHRSVFAVSSIATIRKHLLGFDFVTYIGQESLKATQESTVTDLDLSVNAISTVQRLFPALKGGGRTVGVKDNQFIAEDIDLIQKAVNSTIASPTIDNHATDMSTIIAGLGNSSIIGKGVAQDAILFMSDFNNLLPDSQQLLEDAQVSIQNHSYGTQIENFYGALAASYDQQIYDNPSMLHVFSSGNEGVTVPEDGIYANLGMYANLTGNFKMAKNILTVGAIDREKNSVSFSSKGPAFDGRIKPEIVAYSNVGTSNTAALVTGTSVLLEQAYENIETTSPTSAMLKAVLINGADDIGDRGPDFETGFGNLNAKNSMNIVTGSQYWEDNVQQNETKTLELVIPVNAKNLKVTLVWTDLAAQPNDNVALVNDLDLIVTDPANTNWLPWTLNTEASTESITAPATRNADHINNIEQVTITDLSAGIYTVEVNGFSIATDNQPFALAYSWETANVFDWNFPRANDNYPYDGESIGYLRWQQTYPENTFGALSVSFDNGTTWEEIDATADLAAGFYQWEQPENINTNARLRMQINGNDHFSENFTVSTAINPRVSLDCEEAIELRWNKKEGATSYNIYNLQGREMALVQQVTDTTYAFDKDQYLLPYFSVQARLDPGNAGVRGKTINYESFGGNCYFNSVFADITEDGTAIQVFTDIGSLYQVAQVEVVRIDSANNRTVIETLTNLDTITPEIFDEQPKAGQNKYQLVLTTINGEEYRSDVVDAFFFDDQEPFLIFPNPVSSSGGINVYSGNEGDNQLFFDLYSFDGRKVLTKKLSSDRAFISMNGLDAGVYIYNITSSDGRKMSKKLVIK